MGEMYSFDKFRNALNQFGDNPEPESVRKEEPSMPASEVSEEKSVSEKKFVSDEAKYGGTTKRLSENLVRYEGVLGSFVYDSSQFELREITVDGSPEDGTQPGSFPILSYIGSETDGDKIHIPIGITDTSMMFDGCETLVSAPYIPDSVKTSFAMFRGCKNMQTMTQTLSPNLTDAQFMFQDCESLRTGPSRVPGSVRDCTAMFAGCKSLRNTPCLEDGILCTDSMFVDCASLKQKPSVPKSVQYADHMTSGCKNIDASEQYQKLQQYEQARERFDKSANRKTVGAHLGSVFSAVMQYHMLRTRNYSIMQSVLAVRDQRESGMFKNTASSGWASLYNAHKTGLSGALYKHMAKSAIHREEAYVRKQDEKRERFDATNRLYKEASFMDNACYNQGKKAAGTRAFSLIGKSGYPFGDESCATIMYRLDHLESKMEQAETNGTIPPHLKKEYAREMIELMSNQESYYQGAMSGCAGNKEAVRGLDLVNRAAMNAIFERAEALQARYQFMNDRQISVMQSSACHTSYADVLKKDSSKVDAMRQAFWEKDKKTVDSVNQLKNSNARQDFRQRRGLSRSERVDADFGFFDNQVADPESSFEK